MNSQSLSVTRNKAQLFEDFGIKNDLIIHLERDHKTESLLYLNANCGNDVAQPVQSARATRRASIAGANLYRVGNTFRETGSDFLERIRFNRQVQVGPKSTTAAAAPSRFTIKIRKPETTSFRTLAALPPLAGFDSPSRSFTPSTSSNSFRTAFDALGALDESDNSVKTNDDFGMGGLTIGMEGMGANPANVSCDFGIGNLTIEPNEAAQDNDGDDGEIYFLFI